MTKNKYQILFKENVKRVDIENYNVCNRKCRTCPQSLGIRDNARVLFEQTLFEKLLSELSSCEYDNTIAIGRYHEPLLYFDLTLDRIRRIRQVLPKAEIILNTNGDFVTFERISLLGNAGLNEIKIMRYQNEPYTTDCAIILCTEMAEKLGKNIIRKNIIPDENCYFRLENEGNVVISLRSENYYSNHRGNNRGGLLPQLSGDIRPSPCLVTKHSIDIDYNGFVMPCCNMVSDSLQHKPYILGNLKEQAIYEIYYYSQQSDFTKSIQKGDFDLLDTCKYCTYNF